MECHIKKGTADWSPCCRGIRKARRIGLSQVSTEAFHRYWLHPTTLVKLLVLLLPVAHKLSEGG